MKQLVTIGAVALLLGGCGMTERKVDPSTMQKTTQTTSADGTVTIDFAPGEYGQSKQLDIYATCMAKREAQEAKEDALLDKLIASNNPEMLWAWQSQQNIKHVTEEWGKTVRNVWGKGEQDVCQPGTNMYEAIIAEAEAVAKTQQTFINKTGDVLLGIIPDYFMFKTYETFAENSKGNTSLNVDGDGNDIDVTQKDEKIDINAGTTGNDSSVNLDVDNSKVEGSSGSSGSGVTGTNSTLSTLINESESSGLTTGETAVKLTEQGYSPTISGGEIYVDGANYGGW